MDGDIIMVALFASVFGVFYIFLITRNKERMALIEKVEKGANANLFYSEKQRFNWSKFALKIGMFAMGIALGLIVGVLITTLLVTQRHIESPIYLSAIFFFGGLSLVLFYIIDRKSK